MNTRDKQHSKASLPSQEPSKARLPTAGPTGGRSPRIQLYYGIESEVRRRAELEGKTLSRLCNELIIKGLEKTGDMGNESKEEKRYRAY